MGRFLSTISSLWFTFAKQKSHPVNHIHHYLWQFSVIELAAINISQEPVQTDGMKWWRVRKPHSVIHWYGLHLQLFSKPLTFDLYEGESFQSQREFKSNMLMYTFEIYTGSRHLNLTLTVPFAYGFFMYDLCILETYLVDQRNILAQRKMTEVCSSWMRSLQWFVYILDFHH